MHKRIPEFNLNMGEKIRHLSTTGSSGTPFVYPINQSAIDERMGCFLRTTEWYGHFLGMKNARLWRTSRNKSVLAYIKQNLFGRRLELSIYDVSDPKASFLDEKKIEQFCEKIKKHKIRILDGYVNALTLLADYVLKHKIKNLPVKSVVSGAEYLSPYSRKIIEKAFCCKVINRYGGSEISLMAHQCDEAEDEQLHVMSDKILLEVLKSGTAAKPGELGEIAVTDFTNKAMPFIRYLVGDVAIAEDKNKTCKCGRDLNLLQKVEGRVNDLFKLPDGRILTSHVWHVLFRSIKEIKKFQIVQKKIDTIEVSVVLEDKNYDLKPLKENVQGFLPGCNVIWHVVENIDVGPGGKLRHSMSEVPYHLNEIRSSRIAPNRHIGNIAPYKLTSSHKALEERGASLKLDWNEGTIQPPQPVIDAVLKAIGQQNFLNWYPDITHDVLKKEISSFNKVDQKKH